MAIVCRGLAQDRTPLVTAGLGLWRGPRGAGPPALAPDDTAALIVREDEELLELVMLLVTRVLQ
jgi:hypothetical protein